MQDLPAQGGSPGTGRLQVQKAQGEGIAVKRHHQPSCLHRCLELLIDPDWSRDQTLSVIELLDDLRDRIWALYELALAAQLRGHLLPPDFYGLTPAANSPLSVGGPDTEWSLRGFVCRQRIQGEGN